MPDNPPAVRRKKPATTATCAERPYTFLDGDVADTRREDAAEHFQVSLLAVRSILVNNNRIERREAMPQ